MSPRPRRHVAATTPSAAALIVGVVCGLLVALSQRGSRGGPAELQFVWGSPRTVLAAQQLAAERAFDSPNWRADGYLPFDKDAARLDQSGVAVDRWPIERESAMQEQARAPFFDDGRQLREKGVKMSGARTTLHGAVDMLKGVCLWVVCRADHGLICASGFDAEKVWPLFDVRPQLQYTKRQLHRLTLASGIALGQSRHV
jgi:hypothetical protein